MDRFGGAGVGEAHAAGVGGGASVVPSAALDAALPQARPASPRDANLAGHKHDLAVTPSASFIPPLPALPTVAPITDMISVNAPSDNLYVPYTVAADAVVYATSLFALFQSVGSGFISPLTNNGTVWNEVADDSQQTLSTIARPNHVRLVENNGLMVLHLGPDTTRNAIAFEETPVNNSGRIFVINEGAGNAWLTTTSLTAPTTNSGLVAVQALHGTAIGYEFDNEGEFANLAGGQLYVEGQSAIAFYCGGSDLFVPLQLSNAGTMVATSLDPDQLSFGFYVGGLTDDKTVITNSGVLAADVAIFGDDDTATISQQAIQQVHNLANGEIYGLVYLQRGNDSLDNAGVIHGIVDMGEGADSVDTSAGVIDGVTDLGWDDDTYLGGVAMDEVAGGRGADRIEGNGGNDLLVGGGGGDVLIGGSGNDGLFGEWGDDRIVTRGGDFVEGGEGDDRIELGDYTFEWVDGGDGFDTLVLPAGARSLSLTSALGEHALGDIEEIELGGDKTLVIQAADVVGLTGSETSLRLVTGASDHVDLVGAWVHGSDTNAGGFTWQLYTYQGGDTGPVDVLVRGGATVVTGAAAGGGALDPLAPGGYAPLPGEDLLDYTDPVTYISNYELTRSTTIDYYETWISDDGAPLVTIYSGHVTLTNDGAIMCVLPADSTVRNAGIAIKAPNADEVVNNGTISIDSEIQGSLGGSAFAVSGGYFTKVTNHGQVTAFSAQGPAQGVTAAEFYNNGDISAHAAKGSAIGVELLGRGFDNWGTITSRSDGLESTGGISLPPMYGLPAAVGAYLHEGNHVNAGRITASAATAGSAAVAYDLVGDATLTNGGVLSAETAIWERGQSAASIFHLINLYQIEGTVQLGLANDLVENSGRIDGAVNMGAGDDVFDGSAGVQTGVVSGQEGNDRLTGGAGGDYLDGGTGDDTMIGGAGDDVYVVDSLADVVTELAGGGTDEIRTTLTNLTLPANVERLVYIGTGNVTMTGDAGDNNFAGNTGADYFNLSQGGEDTASGGGGNDGFYLGKQLSAGDNIDGGAGTDDQLGVQGNYSYTFGAGNLVGIETLAVLSGHDGRFGDGSESNYTYNLTTVDANVAGGTTLTVNANNLAAGESLTFNGSAETDGKFFFYAGLGTDNLTGGQQSDGFFFGEGGRFAPTDHVDGQGGADDQLGIRGDYSALTVFSATSMVGIETLALLSAQDSRFAAAGTAYSYNLKLDDANVAAGARLTVSGNNLRADESLALDGSSETNGSFRFFAGAGADTLKGGAGDDQFIGGLGKDVMTGNGGNDTFYFRTTAESGTGANADQIIGFTTGDRIDLSAIDADTLANGNQSFAYLDGGAFTNHAGEARITGSGTSWTLQVDTNGDGVADMEIAIGTDGHVPVIADFVL